MRDGLLHVGDKYLAWLLSHSDEGAQWVIDPPAGGDVNDEEPFAKRPKSTHGAAVINPAVGN